MNHFIGYVQKKTLAYFALMFLITLAIAFFSTSQAAPQASDLAADIVFVWGDDQDSNGKYQILGRGLSSLGTERFADADMNQIANGQQIRPDVSMWESGVLSSVVVWQDDADENGIAQIKGRTFHVDGNPAGSDFTVNAVSNGDQLYPVVATAGEQRFVSAWMDESDENSTFQIKARGLDGANGDELFAQIDVSAASGQHFLPQIAARANGDFVIVWEDDQDQNGFYEIKARGFDRKGQERFSEITVNTISQGQQRVPDVGMSDDGSFVVTWQDDADGNGFNQILARGFDEDGNEKFKTVTVNSAAAGQQQRARIGVASNGNFVVVWEDDADDNGFYQILARGFHPDGKQRFHDVTVNSFYEGQQRNPTIGMRNDGEFVIGWEDDADDNGFYQIKARGFAPNGTQRFADITVNSVPNGQQLTPAVSVNPAPAARTIDLVIGMYRHVPTSEQATYNAIFDHLADGIYEMSNGAHKIGKIKILNLTDGLGDNVCDPKSKNGISPCHVIWRESQWPRASLAGYGKKSQRMYMGDIFPFEDDDGNPTPYDALDANHAKEVGYTFAHELGHYYYGLSDEYDVKDSDTPVPDSVMNDQWRAAWGKSYLLWLNFSTDKNFNQNNSQARTYGASGWTTLMRPQSQDPRNGSRNKLPKRPYFAELANVGPSGDDDPTLEIDVDSNGARTDLKVEWIDTLTGRRSANVSVPTNTFNGLIESISSTNVSYPEPVILTAEVGDFRNITRLSLSAGVMGPSNTSTSIMLKDDGVSPDREAEDGVYTGYMHYSENGEHKITANFSNGSGHAVFTSLNTFHTNSISGGVYKESFELVGENFDVTATTSVFINNVTADDHSDLISDATTLLTNNSDLTGQISKPRDKDLFKVVPSESGKLVVRITDLALGIVPSMRLIDQAGDEISVHGFDSENSDYLFTELMVIADVPFYVEVSDGNFSAEGGIYNISAGSPLENELMAEQPDFTVYLPLILR